MYPASSRENMRSSWIRRRIGKAPVFLAEISSSETRGRIVARNEFMIVFGRFLAFVINAVIHNYWGSSNGRWCVMLLVAVLSAFGLFFELSLIHI